MSTSEIFALRKQGRSADALEMARAEYPQNTDDVWFLRAYAWALYDHAKNLIDRYEAKQLLPTALSGQLSPYVREFARIGNLLRSDSTFSQMLRLACVVSKDWREFLGFARWAGVDDFSDDDKKPFVNEQGKSIDSLQKRFIRAICREAAAGATDAQANPEWVDWGKGILTKALQSEPNDQWLNYYQSKLHLAYGEADEAVKRLAPVLHRQSRAAWPWALLGEILEASRADDALTCYAYATQLAREEQEVAKVRIHLAQRLSLAGRYNEAAQQTQQAIHYREEHGYRIPQELAQLLASDWYQQAVANNSLERLPDVERAARAVLRDLDRQSLIYVQGVIDHINAEKALTYVVTARDAGFGLPHRKFPAVASLPPGTLVEVGRAGPQGLPADWRLSEAESLPGLCETLSGSLERHEGKDFAFVRTAPEDVFVPPELAKEFATGQQYDVTCLAIKRTNKQGKTGWRAVKIIKKEQQGDGNGIDRGV
jgi:tetratricopeptide (TPR) repeat protein